MALVLECALPEAEEAHVEIIEDGERIMVVAASTKLLVASSLPGVSWLEISPYVAEQVAHLQ